MELIVFGRSDDLVYVGEKGYIDAEVEYRMNEDGYSREFGVWGDYPLKVIIEGEDNSFTSLVDYDGDWSVDVEECTDGWSFEKHNKATDISENLPDYSEAILLDISSESISSRIIKNVE